MNYLEKTMNEPTASGTPRVFIGSSKEGIEVARAIFNQLHQVAEIKIWHLSNIFHLNHGYLEDLLKATHDFDFAIFVLSADDSINSRDERSFAPRDNVLFEFGLFMGQLGRDRTFAIFQESNNKLPSDLDGVSIDRYQVPKDGDLVSAVEVPIYRIRNSIRSLGIRQERLRQDINDPPNNNLEPVQQLKSLDIFTFCGITKKDDKDFLSILKEADDLEQVYFLWADAQARSSVSAEVIPKTEHSEKFIRIKFDNKKSSAPSNVAIRPGGMVLIYREEGFQKIKFKARIPSESSRKTDLKKIQLSIRVIDALTTHWKYMKRGDYYEALIVEDIGTNEWTDMEVDLSNRDRKWKVFESDGNWLYRAKDPDFTAILAIIIEVGSEHAQRPGAGQGIIDIKDFIID